MVATPGAGKTQELHSMINFRQLITLILAVFFVTGQTTAADDQSTPILQTQRDSYTRYELLTPDSSRFRIYYDVSATTKGGRYYYNPIREGSESQVNGVFDRMSGETLDWEVVDGKDAQQNGLPDADPKYRFIKATLPRTIAFDSPDDVQVRLLIDKTYKDQASYFTSENLITFKRALGIKRNQVVLPAGYELVSVNYPSQVIREADGRISVSFINPGAAAVEYKVTARPVRFAAAESTATIPQAAAGNLPAATRPKARVDYAIPEQAGRTRDIVYYLQQPETHQFRLYHDYTETTEGVDRYLNVVRPGSRASNPSAYLLDTGESLKVETLLGSEINERGIEIGEQVTDQTELVVIWFDAVKEGRSKRIRIWETYTDPGRYFLNGDQLFWDRSFGRSQNTVVLPPGWSLTDSAIPATIRMDDQGRTELRFINDRPGVIDVLLRAERRIEKP